VGAEAVVGAQAKRKMAATAADIEAMWFVEDRGVTVDQADGESGDLPWGHAVVAEVTGRLGAARHPQGDGGAPPQ
jgi:hypothetical protein